MIAALKDVTDRFFGRGEAAITVPPFDGALKPNQLLEAAAVVCELESPEDLASDGRLLYIADGTRILSLPPEGEGGAQRRKGDVATESASPGTIESDRTSPIRPFGAPSPSGGRLQEIAVLDAPITALAALPGGGFAVALDGRAVRIVGGAHDGRTWDAANGRPFNAVNALSATPDGKLLATDGSQSRPYAQWSHDLMELGRSGRLIELVPADGGAREIAAGLSYAFGACATADGVWVSESWRHRLVSFNGGKAGTTVLDRLPAYPSRLTPATGGGYWLTAFIARTQLVEFILREPGYRKRMMAEIDPRHWVAPALGASTTFLEPMQGAHIKTMGILKPWAPPRSYGLVMRLTPQGLVRYSLHSRIDGQNHGVVAAIDCGGALFVLSKGRRRLLRLDVADIERSLQA